MNLRPTLDDNTDFFRSPECEMMMTYNMILSRTDDTKWREHEAKFKQITNEWKWYENDRMLRAKRLEKVMSIVSLVTIENLPVQITLSIYTFKYTHTTQGFTTQWRMRWWMLKWVNGYGCGDDDTIVMTLITMVRYFRIFARHDNPSLYAFFYMNILNDTSLYTVTLLFARKLSYVHISCYPYGITMTIS